MDNKELDLTPFDFDLQEAYLDATVEETSAMCRTIGISASDLEADPGRFAAGLVWVHLRRRQQGVTWQNVASLSNRTIQNIFAANSDELTPEESDLLGVDNQAGK